MFKCIIHVAQKSLHTLLYTCCLVSSDLCDSVFDINKVLVVFVDCVRLDGVTTCHKHV
jgi:hypothetical protein